MAGPSPIRRFFNALTPKRPGWEASAAILFIAAGFVVIAKAWDGAASIDFAQGQIPYLLSGGAAGIGLIVVGVTLLVFESMRRYRVRLDAQLTTIAKALEDLAEGARAQRPATSSEDIVVAGRTSYHRPDCRLVAARDDNEVVSYEEATTRALTPCRVCRPELARS